FSRLRGDNHDALQARLWCLLTSTLTLATVGARPVREPNPWAGLQSSRLATSRFRSGSGPQRWSGREPNLNAAFPLRSALSVKQEGSNRPWTSVGLGPGGEDRNPRSRERAGPRSVAGVPGPLPLPCHFLCYRISIGREGKPVGSGVGFTASCGGAWHLCFMLAPRISIEASNQRQFAWRPVPRSFSRTLLPCSQMPRSFEKMPCSPSRMQRPLRRLSSSRLSPHQTQT